MSIIVQIDDKAIAQGWSGWFNIGLINTGTQSLYDANLKIVDTAVFDSVEVAKWNTGYDNCLNVFSAGFVKNVTGNSTTFPPGTTRDIRLNLQVKPGASIQLHSIECEWQYVIID